MFVDPDVSNGNVSERRERGGDQADLGLFDDDVRGRDDDAGTIDTERGTDRHDAGGSS